MQEARFLLHLITGKAAISKYEKTVKKPTRHARHICKEHKANVAKEPALFQRFQDTLRFGGHLPSIQLTKTKDDHTTGSLANGVIPIFVSSSGSFVSSYSA